VDGASFAYVGGYKKTTDTDFAISPTQMGARVYVAELGRFLQADPVEGGTDNDYAYVNDPVNDYDLNGQWGFGDVFNWVKNIVKSVIKKVVEKAKPYIAAVKGIVKTAVKVVTSVIFPTKKPTPPSLKPKVTTATSTSRGKGATAKATSARATKPKVLGGNYSLQLDQLMVNIPKSSSGKSDSGPYRTAKRLVKAAAAGCVSGAAVTLATVGSLSLVTLGATAAPTAAGAGVACGSGLVWGFFYSLVTGKEEDDSNAWMWDVHEGLRQ
jgi:RHS repeat-associated protein